jgi:alpha-glucoside transport system substrate-binding protein
VTAARAVRVARMAWALLVVLAACGCSGPPDTGSVTVLVPWGGAELVSFKAVVDSFMHSTGISVHVEPTRGLSEELGADLQEGGDPPDIAVLPSAGAIAMYAGLGKLKPLDNAVAAGAYGPPWSDLMRPKDDGHIYAVPVKVDVKSLIWYDPAMFHHLGIVAPPASWTQLVADEKTIEAAGGSPWCLAMASPPTSGWPGADWIADILLGQSGRAAYQEWVRGELKWDTGPVERSWQTWGNLIGAANAIYKGRDNALAAAVGSIRPGPGGCYLQHGTLFDENFPAKVKYPYDFFPFPAQGTSGTSIPIQVSADFIGVFKDNPLAFKLVSYLTSKAEQEKFVTYQGPDDGPRVDGFSANKDVPASAYKGEGQAIERIAGLLTHRELCFSAADAMPPELGADFYQAILEYLAAPNLAAPKTLTSTILPELQSAANSVRSTGAADAASVCGGPIPASGRSS